MVPGLVYLLGLPQRMAHGTSLAATVLFASAGVGVYGIEDRINLPYAGIILAGSAFGVLAGTRLLQSVSIRGLQLLFALLMCAAAGRLLSGLPGGTETIRLGPGSVAALITLGVAVGIVAGLLGIGGGILIVPSMVLFFQSTELEAKGTSLLVVLVTAAIGSVRNWRYRNLNVQAALLIGIGGAASAFAGAMLAGVLNPRLSSVLIAVLMLIIALRILAEALRRRSPATTE